ncbi:MAG: hypothetical protein F4Y66_07095, partial [Acidimicrobiales bacterium]|nr:hypothetical protein [Acidimicrobiales bacterium]
MPWLRRVKPEAAQQTAARPDEPAPAAAPQTPAELDTQRRARRTGTLIATPGALYLLIFFMVPLGLITVYSFATRTSTGRTSLSGWNL